MSTPGGLNCLVEETEPEKDSIDQEAEEEYWSQQETIERPIYKFT
jgi:hypothetical protein